MDYYHRTPNTQSYFNSFDKFELVSPRKKLILCDDVSFCAIFATPPRRMEERDEKDRPLILISAKKGIAEHSISKFFLSSIVSMFLITILFSSFMSSGDEKNSFAPAQLTTAE
jgi:hypothetical protein